MYSSYKLTRGMGEGVRVDDGVGRMDGLAWMAGQHSTEQIIIKRLVCVFIANYIRDSFLLPLLAVCCVILCGVSP